jgi:CCR4-NOT transcription complex subunit 1
MQLPNFQELPKNLKDFIEYGSKGALPINNAATFSPQVSLTPPMSMQHPFNPAVAAGGGNQLPAPLNQLQNKFVNNLTLQQQTNAMSAGQVNNMMLGQAGMMNAIASAAAMASAGANRGNMNMKPSIANTTNIETLLVANENDIASKPIAPSEFIQDKVAFIFNNLSLSNMQSKTDEIREVLKDEFWDWIAHYLVVKRVSIEPNFHTLYSQFVDTLKKDILNDHVLSETYRNIKVLLRSDKNDQKFSDRALLKNLGSWLGLITLAKNKPILHRDIDLKSLIIEAFHKGQPELLFVVPFVAKVLEPAGKSKIFQPPNPWLLSMLSVLVELHNEPDLKLNHKFEIEVLCKNLSLNINDIPVKCILRNYEIVEEQLTKNILPSAGSGIQQIPKAPDMVQLSNAPIAHIQSMGASQQVHSISQPSGETLSDLSTVSQASNMQTTQVSQPTTQQQPQMAPKYKITDIRLQSLQNNANLIYINPDIPLLNAQPLLRNLIIPTLDKAVNEIMPHLLDKAVKISVSTAEAILKKDFALDPEENHLRIAARSIVANMSSGMMLITGKEPLMSHLLGSLKAQFVQPIEPSLANTFKEMINQACSIIVQDNIELCICFLQKIAMQRAILELEHRLKPEFETRLRSKVEGRAHYDSSVLAFQNEKIPEMIRLRVGSVNLVQFSVYEEFGKNFPGFKTNAVEVAQPPVWQPQEEMIVHYENAIGILKNEVTAYMPSGHFLTHNLHAIIMLLQEFKVSQQPQSACNLVKKLVYNLLEGYSLRSEEISTPGGGHFSASSPENFINKYKECNLSVLKVLLNDQRFYSGNWIVKEIQKIWIDCQQDYKYSVEGVGVLFKYKLLNVQTVDVHIAQFVDSGSSKALQLALQFLKYFYIENASSFFDIQLTNLLESLNKIGAVSRYAQQSVELKDLMEVIRMNYESEENFSSNRVHATALSMMYTGVQQARDFDDPPGLKEKSEHLLHDWIQHHALLPQKDNTKMFQQFVLQMNGQGLFKTDEMITRFFRICTELCVDSCYILLGKGQRQLCYQRLDAFVKLIILLVKHSGDQTNHVNKINLFNKVLGLIAGCLLYDQETRGTMFEPMPFHRLLFMLMFEAQLPENNLEPIIYNILQAFVNVFHILRPSKAPGFAYSWLELVAHRIFLSKMLQMSGQPMPDQNYKPWNMYAILLTQLIRFLAPFLRNIELTQSIMLLYKGTLRLFLVLLHDFPEFLCNCHYQLCDAIPCNCIQLRNLVLSAFPRSMKLPDPLTPNLKVDMIADIDSNPPKITFPYIYNIPYKLKNDIDSYIKTRAPVTFLSELRSYLQSAPDTGSHYNIQLMNALVIYVGSLGIQALRAKGLTPTYNNLTHSAHSAYSDIFQSLVVDLDSEGRYLFINAVANQLRYPNSHTHYFGCALLNLFAEANSEAIQEQITRLVDFIQKNKNFFFFSKFFIYS